MFRYLRTKLTVLYAGLFGAGLLLISGGVYAAIVGNAQHMVRSELAAGGAVFDRLWALRSNQLQDGAGILSRDFGFRSAVATRDEATIGSALSNLKAASASTWRSWSARTGGSSRRMAVLSAAAPAT